MNYSEIEKALRVHILSSIDRLIAGEIPSNSLNWKIGISMSDTVKYFRDLGVETDTYEDLSTNGWQWDAWFDIKYQGYAYTVSTSGYEGGLEITREPIEDNE